MTCISLERVIRLGTPRTIVRAIIHKWRKLGTVVNLPRSGWPTKITQRRLIQRVIKEPRTTSKELQALLASIKVSVHESTIRKRLGKNGIHGRVPRQKPFADQKEHKGLSHIFQNIDLILNIPKTFGQIFCGLFGMCVCRYMWHKTNTTFHKKNIILPVKHGGGSLMVWDCFADFP
uniref:Transposase Tc1-like domain-containing protein n=1 Tax=Cyprinus carpio carpio TaxID=630221 RepID=A0A9J7YLT4_CYPCA